MKRNKFNLSHYKCGTAPFGKVVPISCFEVLPGDTVQMGSSIFFRLSPMVNPSFSILKCKWWHFFVPYRLLYSDWEDFRTGGSDGLDTSTPPYFNDASLNGIAQGSLCDYLGLPVGYTGDYSAFPVRAYFRICNEYFRDQDLTSPNIYGTATTGGLQSNAGHVGGFGLYSYAWEKDYFTTARPWPQKGAEVSVPVNSPSSTTLSVDGSTSPTFSLDSSQFNPNVSPQNWANGFNLRYIPSGPNQGKIGFVDGTNTEDDPILNLLKWNNANLSVTSSSDGSIGNVRLDDLREAFALQRFEEARAMYGSRYTEYLRYLGIRSSDARLQRPEYLGGGRTTMQISEVLQTGEDGTNPVGTLRGHGVGAGRSKRFRRFIEEDGLIMTLMSIMPVTLYAQGVHKMWSRTVKEDFWTKELQHIGQQEVLTKELYGNVTDQTTVFGYQNRYDDYRSVPSTVCGQMRPGGVDEDWTMARIFNNAPVLNTSFIYGAPSLRNFAEQNYHPIYFMASHSVVARRLMSKTGNPIL